MNDKSKFTMPVLYSSIMYLCGLLLFIEWLYPVRDITDTESISIFVLYAVFAFFISMIHMKWWLSFGLKAFGLVFILNGLYFDMLFLSPAWFSQLLTEVVLNINYLFSQEWYYLTPLFRSFLFLLLIWLMSYLLHYWFVQMKRIFLFIMLTFIYIGVLDTFTLYDASSSIVRVFIVSLVALAMVNFSRDLEKEKISFHWLKKAPTWLLPLALTILFSVVIGTTLPKLDPQWPDPVPFIQSAVEQGGSSPGGGTVQKVGYGEDDSRLGGSFIQDDSTVFFAETSEDHYWRIETRDVYTGKGWENSSETNYVLQEPNDIRVRTFPEYLETEEQTAHISFEADQLIDKIVYPYGLREVNIDIGTIRIDYYMDTASQAIQARLADGGYFDSTEYSLVYDQPTIPLELLQNSSNEAADMEQYLQLPDDLPERVGDLAEEVTENHASMYDKVRAIERYFSRNNFSYETTGVAVPGANEDYVDQFLFETQAGYCDNFSSSMVVMLRTLDIPARWAKGFTSGERLHTGETHDVYEVTNANAHSWVEVYFPEAGWVTFEPTQGFSNPTSFQSSMSDEEREAYDDILDQPDPEQPEEDVTDPEEEESEAAMASPSNNDFNFKWWQIAIGVVLVLAIAYLIFKNRYRIKTKYYQMKLSRNTNEENFQAAYLHLLNLLGHHGYEREPDQTLRQFARRMDGRFKTRAMQELTNYYERMLYRNEFNEEDAQKLKELWKNLTRKITG